MEEEKKENKTVPENSNEQCPGVEDKEAGKLSGCAGCPNQSLCASGKAKEQQTEQKIELADKLQSIKHKIIVLSGKGGVGKSTVATQIAFGLADKGYEVGLLDVDLCGPSIPKMLGLQQQEVHSSNSGWSPVYVNDNLGVMSIGFLLNNQDDAVIWRGPRKTGLIKQFVLDVDWGNLDFLIVDTPPGTGDEHISLAQFLQMDVEKDGAVIVTTPQEIALLDVRKELSFCQKSKIKVLGVIENMSGFKCPHCNCETEVFKATTGGADQMCKDYSLSLLGKIPLDPTVSVTAESGKKLDNDVFTPIIAQLEKGLLE